MSLKFKEKGTIFPQEKVQRNFTDNFTSLRKTLNVEDASVFFMLADATCSTKPTVDIEKIHVDVFRKEKKITPRISKGWMETLAILNDEELMKEIRLSKEETSRGRTISWKKAKIPA